MPSSVKPENLKQALLPYLSPLDCDLEVSSHSSQAATYCDSGTCEQHACLAKCDKVRKDVNLLAWLAWCKMLDKGLVDAGMVGTAAFMLCPMSTDILLKAKSSSLGCSFFTKLGPLLIRAL